MRNRRLLPLFSTVFLLTNGERQETSDQQDSIHGSAMVQRLAHVQAMRHAVEDSEPGLDHAHFVCHSEGCAEVKARLTVLKNQANVTAGKLAECSRTRATLTGQLTTAAAERAKVAAALAQCAEERAALQEKVEECGETRADLERALGECAASRGKLEAELTQCAEVDRPAAEKALAECGIARAELEKKLQELAKQLENGSGTSATRRRSGRRRKTSLLEMGFELNSTMAAEVRRIEDALHKNEQEGDSLQALIGRLGKKESALAALMGKTDAEFKTILQEMESNENRAEEVFAKLKALLAKQTQAVEELNENDEHIQNLANDTEVAATEEANAQETLAGENAVIAETTGLLLEILMKDKEVEHKNLARSLDEQKSTLLELKSRLNASKDEEECDDLRAQIITVDAELKTKALSLKACLDAKKEISEKIAAATEAKAKADKSLQECLSTKVKLKAALAECKSRCAQTKKLLEECLNRKKYLNKKIEECHTARDLARKKLAECLSRKAELKTKIEELKAKLKKMGLLDTKHMDTRTDLREPVGQVLDMINQVNNAEQLQQRAQDEESRALAEAAEESQQETEEVAHAANAIASAGKAANEASELMNKATRKLLESSAAEKQVAAEERAAGAVASSTATNR